MEHVEGDTIDRWCVQHKAGTADVLQLFRQLCEAVAYAHRKGILHRDLKPANIMVTQDGLVKLMDFGIAGQATDDEGEALTGAFAPMTPEYASPEQYHGGEVTSASDVFALGLVLFQLLCGKRPREAQGQHAAGLHNLAEAQSNSLLSDAATLVAELLAPNPAERPDCDALISRLTNLLHDGVPAGGASPHAVHYDAVVWHHPEAAAAVEDLARRLQDETGLNLWLDAWYRGPGEDPATTLITACGQTDCLLVPITRTGGEPWSDPNQSEALSQFMSGDTCRVVPLLFADAERPERESVLPAFLRRRAWVSLSEAAFHTELKALARTLRGDPRLRVEETPTDTCPFKGLEAFRQEDSRFFRGREAVTQRLAAHMARHRFLAVLGPSGSGKSSVVQAGLIPLLAQQGNGIVLFTPAAHPMEELAFALSALVPEQSRTETLVDRLNQHRHVLHFIAREIVATGGPAELVLVIDQFEEIFTLAHDREEVSRFLDALLSAVEKPDAIIRVVLTMRSDFLGKSALWPDLDDFITEQMIHIKPMDREERYRAVTEPAHLAGLQFETGLVEKILDDLPDESGELPLLEHALLELYRRRVGKLLTAAAYTDIGGIEGALAKRAETEYQAVSEREQHIIRKMFTLALIHPGEGAEDTRRRAERRELKNMGDDEAEAEALLQRLIDARLLTAFRDETRGVDQIDVAHEALIRKWSRIKQWMAEDRETARQFNRLRALARAWDEASRDEDHLLRGGPLLQAEELAARTSSRLGPLEKAFIESGLQTQRKAARRKKLRRGTVLGLSLTALVITAWLALNWRGSLQEAQRQAHAASNVAQFLTDIFQVAEKDRGAGRQTTVEEVIDRGVEQLKNQLLDQPETRFRLLMSIGRIYDHMGRYEEALAHQEEALNLSVGSLEQRVALLNQAAVTEIRRGHFQQAQKRAEKALHHARTNLGDHTATADALYMLGTAHSYMGNYSTAEGFAREALTMRRQLFGQEHTAVADSINLLAGLLRARGDSAASEPLSREALALMRKLLGREHPSVATGLNDLALLLHDRGKLTEAEPLFRESLAIHRKLEGEGHPHVAILLNNLADLLAEMRRFDEAAGYQEEALAIYAQKPNPWRQAVAQSVYGRIQAGLGKTENVQTEMEAAYHLLAKEEGPHSMYARDALARLVEVCDWMKQPEQAARWRQKLEEAEAALSR
ncbi:MAG: tetratricopeptide repeat protein [Acidobacteriota bacterium]|nr:tetratricopeptide repeat protein [Acidobacteriota bacterium]